MAESDFLVWLHKSNTLLYVFVIVFILFLITRAVIFAVLTGALLISLFVLDIVAGVKRHGIGKEIWEVIIAIVFALSVWFGLQFVLKTSSPVSGIVSCSMLPAYERGDMIILIGAKPDEITAPIVELTQEEFANITGVNPPCGKMGVVEYSCSECNRISVKNGSFVKKTLCVKEIRIKNQTVAENLSNEVIVYVPSPHPGRIAYGEIIHRVFTKLLVDGKYYFLTKGDNNDYFDSVMFKITPEENVKGKVLLRIPWLGYLKLFISGYFEDPAGCETIIQR